MLPFLIFHHGGGWFLLFFGCFDPMCINLAFEIIVVVLREDQINLARYINRSNLKHNRYDYVAELKSLL